MVSGAQLHRYTYLEYVALEADANVRHEFLDGEIYAMAGGSPEHALLCANLIGAFFAALRGGPCRAYASDLRVRVLGTGLTTYPDVTVVCGPLELDPENRNTVTNPILVVEVLGPSTAAYDRGVKLEHYKQIPSLREVALVAYDERLIEVWQRGEDGGWMRREARHGSVTLTSIGAVLDVGEVYQASATSSSNAP